MRGKRYREKVGAMLEGGDIVKIREECERKEEMEKRRELFERKRENEKAWHENIHTERKRERKSKCKRDRKKALELWVEERQSNKERKGVHNESIWRKVCLT